MAEAGEHTTRASLYHIFNKRSGGGENSAGTGATYKDGLEKERGISWALIEFGCFGSEYTPRNTSLFSERAQDLTGRVKPAKSMLIPIPSPPSLLGCFLSMIW